MARGGKKEAEKAVAEANPEAEERKRLNKLAFSKGILSEAPAKPFSVLSPSKTVTKHHGTDILRKSHRKNRFLFSFPGLLAPISCGKIIFSDAWWIGRKDENPEETRLEFPRELYEAHHSEYDFKGGAGAASEMKQGVNKSGLKYVEQESPKTDLEDDSSDGQNNLLDLPQVTPVRHSERTTGKRFNFAEEASGDDFVSSDVDTSEGEDKEGGLEELTRDYIQTENSCPVVFDIDNNDAALSTRPSRQDQQPATSVTNQKELSHCNHISLVQTTISTLFKKVEEKVKSCNLGFTACTCMY
ncbi:root hair initiation protein root hairless 1 [Actinidia rufa]|uniref:Root hair initiation protein root hairless 1 n=1 Tax=Actinidia rufa TaxID=165716 RepID=A0A7J0DR18_9ERIC|nr:root hair initiation protein root hairless 1 [Actinidia rufa]